MELDSLEKLYIEELKDLYSAENQILKAMPKLIGAANSAELKRAFKKHEGQTRQHVEHYEMAGYGTVRTWARILGRRDDVALLQKPLNEEGDTDKGLTVLAKTTNIRAE